MSAKIFGKRNFLILILFGIVGQIAWAVENMYFNMFVFDTIAPDLTAITLMVQLSGITATVVTLVAGCLSDKMGNRRSFISWGYVIWGVSVALFGMLNPSLVEELFGVGYERAVSITLVSVIVGDCIMTLFGSSANDASFNAWVTDNTESSYRGKIEGILSILPLLAMLIVAGGFGMLVELVGYKMLFVLMGVVITASGVLGIFIIKDCPELSKNGCMRDIFYGFRPTVVRENSALYLTLLIVLVYGVCCQVFMPYLIIYMKTYLHFSVLEYSAVFAVAIILGAAVNLYLTRLSDGLDKKRLLYVATAAFATGLFAMFIAREMGKTANLICFGIAGFIMICGYIFIAALTGSLVRDYTPKDDVGKLQGVRMVFSVLIPMIIGPMIGNGINSIRRIPLPSADTSADAMTTSYIPAPEIFLAASLLSLLMLLIIPALKRADRTK